MGDMGEYFRAWKDDTRERRRSNLLRANANDDGGWTKHTEWHWSRKVAGTRLDYWPSSNKFQYLGRIQHGGVLGFIKNREKEYAKKNTA